MKILILAQTPPPFHGQAIMQKYLVDAKWDWCVKTHIRMNYSGEINEIGKFKISKVISLSKLVLKVWKERLKSKIDVIYYPPAGPDRIPFFRDIVTMLLIRWTARKIVFHFHAGGINRLLSRLNAIEKLIAGVVLKKPDAGIVLSKHYLNEITWFRSKKEYVVPNGIEDVYPQYQSKHRGSVFTLLSVGIISEEKGIYDILECAKILKNSMKKFYWDIAGNFVSNEEAIKCNELIKEYKLEKNIRILGNVTGEEKWKIFNGADLFVFLSKAYEAQPLVLLEAMMFELPVIATINRGIPEIIVDGLNGFLVPVNNPPAAAAKIKSLINDSGLRNKLGKQGRKRFLEHFTLENHLNALEKVFKDTVIGNERN